MFFGYGELYNKGNITYSGNHLLVGRQSFSYIKIESINLQKDATAVTFVLTNNTDKKISGTFHEPGHSIAFTLPMQTVSKGTG